MTDTTLTEPLGAANAPGATAAVPQQAYSLADAAADVANNLADYWWAYLIGIGCVIVVWLYRKEFRDAAREERQFEEQRLARSAEWRAGFEATKQVALKDVLESIEQRLKTEGVLQPQDTLSPDTKQRITDDFNQRHPSELKRNLVAKDEEEMVTQLFAWMQMPPPDVLASLTGRVTPFRPGKPGFVENWTETLTKELLRGDHSHLSDDDVMKPVGSGVDHALNQQDRDKQLALVKEALGKAGSTHQKDVTQLEWLRADLNTIDLSDPFAKKRLDLTRDLVRKLLEADASQMVLGLPTRKERMANLDHIQTELDNLAKVPEAEWNPHSGETWAERRARLEQQRTAQAEQEKNAQLSEINDCMTALGARLAVGENMEDTKEYESLLALSLQVNAIDPSDPSAREQLGATATAITNVNDQIQAQSQRQAGSLAPDQHFKDPRADNDFNKPSEEKPVGDANPKHREREHMPES